MARFFGKSGEEISMALWSGLHNEPGYSEIGFTEVDDCTVSTIWLGLVYDDGPSPPLIFETMIDRRGEWSVAQRYATWAEATSGHAEAVAALREELNL